MCTFSRSDVAIIITIIKSIPIVIVGYVVLWIQYRTTCCGGAWLADSKTIDFHDSRSTFFVRVSLPSFYVNRIVGCDSFPFQSNITSGTTLTRHLRLPADHLPANQSSSRVYNIIIICCYSEDVKSVITGSQWQLLDAAVTITMDWW